MEKDNKPKPRQTISLKRTVFVSQLACDTLTGNMNYFIKSKLEHNVDVWFQKFKSLGPRTIKIGLLTT